MHILSPSDVVQKDFSPEGVPTLALPALLSLTQGGVVFVRDGGDLVIESGSDAVVIEGYFTASPPPTLTTATGGHYSPSLVASLLERSDSFPQRYAQEGGKGQTIGEIVSTQGQVQVSRDGSVMTLKAGDAILEGDTVSTGEGAEVFMRFTDDMEFRLGEDARLAIDEYLYDKAGLSSIQVLSIIQGAFSYTSGLIAAADPTAVKLYTPQGVIGIFGAKILGDVGSGGLSVTILEGRAALLQNDHEITEIDQPFETFRLTFHRGLQELAVHVASVEEVLISYDFLDGSEQQLRAFKNGDPLEDEGGNTRLASATLPDGDEVYIESVSKGEESTSFLSPTEERADTDEDSEENSEIGFDHDDELNFVIDNQPALSDREISFEGSLVDVDFHISNDGYSVFDDVAGLVFRHGSLVEVERRLKSGSEDQYEFVIKGVVDVTGSSGKNILTGSALANRLKGEAGDDSLYGGEGADLLIGGEGGDTLDGGAGADTYIFESGHGADTIQGDAEEGNRIVLRDIASLAELTFTRLDAGVKIENNDNPDDSVTIASYENGRYSIVYDETEAGKLYLGTAEDDVALTGSTGANLLIGFAGNDILEGGRGNDRLEGGEGGDTLDGGAGADTYIFGSGHGADTIQGDAEGGNRIVLSDITSLAELTFTRLDAGVKIKSNNPDDSVTLASYENGRYSIVYGETEAGKLYLGTTEDDVALTGSTGADLLIGFAGNDILEGYGGADTLQGGEGVDTASYASSNKGVRVDLALSEGQADFDGQEGFGNANRNVAVGDVLTDIENIVGSRHADWLSGDDKDNKISGGRGNDRLEGGEGGDTLDGGAGADTYVFEVGGGVDFIYDEKGDTMTLRFEGTSYAASDFIVDANNFKRNNNDLEILVDKDDSDDIIDKITIYNAYGIDLETGTDHAMFTINVVYNNDGVDTLVRDDFWHSLT